MSRIATLLGNLLAVCAAIFIVLKLIENQDVFRNITWGYASMVLSVVAISYSSFVVVIGNWIWNVILSGGGVDLGYRKTFIIYGQAQIGKYLPGNVFHYVGRVALGSAHGIGLEPIVLSMGVETVVTMLSAVLIIAIGMGTGTFNSEYLTAIEGKVGSNDYLFAAAVICICALSLSPLFPGIKRWLLARAAFFKISRVLLTIIVNSTVFISYGVMLSFMQKIFLGPAALVSWYQFTSGFTLAWLVGFVVPGVPGGIGVREAVFVSMFGPQIGFGTATALAILVRIVMSLGDLIAFLAAYALAKVEGKDDKRV